MIYVYFAGSKKTYIFRKMKKKRKYWELTVYVQVYLFIIIYSHCIATNIIQYLLYLVVLVSAYLSVFTQLYLTENGASYCIKELCNLSLEIQRPFTHILMHAHLPDNRKSLTTLCKHLVGCVWVDILVYI